MKGIKRAVRLRPDALCIEGVQIYHLSVLPLWGEYPPSIETAYTELRSSGHR